MKTTLAILVLLITLYEQLSPYRAPTSIIVLLATLIYLAT